MKQLLGEAFIIVVLLTCAILFVSEPAVRELAMVKGSTSAKTEGLQDKPNGKKSVKKSSGVITKALQKRNIFSEVLEGPEGKKKLSKGRATSTPKPSQGFYTLMAIIKGQERVAIFKNPSGLFVSHKTGDQLDDQGKIVSIDELVVTVQMPKTQKHYRIFAGEEQRNLEF